MKGDRIKYRKGYKYQLAEDYTCFVGIFPEKSIAWKWGVLSNNGFATVLEDYAWDGASGPTFDTPDTMRGSLLHDFLYQMMRLGLLNVSLRPQADNLLHDICVEDGMIHARAELWEEAVSMFAGSAVKHDAEPEILTAPVQHDNEARVP
jgi:hypothetical protein